MRGPDADYDPFGPQELADPHGAYRALRNECPVHRYEAFDPPFYSLTRHEDISAALKDWELWSSEWGQSPRFTSQGGLFTDPPEHTWHRRIVQQAFTPRRVAALEPDVEALACELIDNMTADGRRSGDFHDDFACPLPVFVIATMLGVPPADIEQFKAWSDVMVEAMGSPDPLAGADVRSAMNEYFRGFVRQREELLDAGDELPNDLVSVLVAASSDGRRLSEREILGHLHQLLVGGNETTTSLLTNLLWRLLERPELWEKVCADPSLHEVAIEESLRFDAPVLGLFRTNTEQVSLDGATIPEGSKAQMLFASANRDAAVWEDADTFRLDRDIDTVRRHLAFGIGHHFCVGAALSRLEARVSLRLLTDRLPRLRLVGPTERITPFLLWGRRRLPVAWD